jgi:hypothetical protein
MAGDDSDRRFAEITLMEMKRTPIAMPPGAAAWATVRTTAVRGNDLKADPLPSVSHRTYFQRIETTNIRELFPHITKTYGAIAARGGCGPTRLDAQVDHTYMEIEGPAHNRMKMVSRHQAIRLDCHGESPRRARESK